MYAYIFFWSRLASRSNQSGIVEGYTYSQKREYGTDGNNGTDRKFIDEGLSTSVCFVISVCSVFSPLITPLQIDKAYLAP